jgi:hypothetical protein
MEFLGWTITNPAKTRNPEDSRVYAINKKGESFTAETIDAAMRIIMEKNIEIEMDAKE